MIGFDEAAALIEAAATPLGRETVAMAEACGRVLAAPVVAGLDSPASDTSAMDGYAVRAAEVAELPVRLRVIGESFAGRGFDGRMGPGECVRIFTGAPMPAGADRVIIQEIVRRDGDEALFSPALGGGRHVRAMGSDFRAGDTLLQPGRRLDARAMVAAAAADRATVEVWRRPRVVVLGTGDELAEPGSAAGTPGSIPESVSFGVAALIAQYGGEVIGRRRLKDDPASLEAAAAAALDEADLVVVTGGASVGEKDYARAMFGPAGLALIIDKVAIKPGKPVWLGRARDRLVLGLPGNPTSAMVTGRLFLAPLVAGLSGAKAGSALDWRPARLGGALGACGDRETFHRAAWRDGRVHPLTDQDSSAQKALAAADLLIRRRPGEPDAAAGDEVETLDF
ncbi:MULTISPECIES: molybdopterin molybdotransferase MoeA [unclassified Brevundimonas]|uniref:molybdopterin molybdotransferase MoeA n=1 Tax=unclassified Brevundimonas TaxID=2622653 RepID=UPI0006FC8DA4|nr:MULTISPECIES: molybdopterin molybdotransferase MoeA [unclassified Brevundimonas]KQY86603.1 molybdopterin biosynthesis protein MoeA [Brevundimonas sp. Root1423]KRA19328.1 molybdopterin biosynthesis protein MoeA [Brevundimonas sp. Root608]